MATRKRQIGRWRSLLLRHPGGRLDVHGILAEQENPPGLDGDEKDGSGNERDIEPERLTADVFEIHFEAHRQNDSPVMLEWIHVAGIDHGQLGEESNLRESGEAGSDFEHAALFNGVALLDRIGIFRARADDGHLAAEDVENLRKLVDFEKAEKAADGEDAGVILCGEGAEAIGVQMHGPELQFGKWAALVAGADGVIEDGTG